MAPTLLTLWFLNGEVWSIYFFSYRPKKMVEKMTPLMNMARWNMAILMSVEWWTLTSESRSSEALVFCFSPRDFPRDRRVRHDATESSDNLAQATKTCRNLLQVDKKKHVLFPHGNAHLKSGRDLWLFTPKWTQAGPNKNWNYRKHAATISPWNPRFRGTKKHSTAL